MTTTLDFLAALSWWAMLVLFAGVACVLVAAVFFHAFPNHPDDWTDR